MQAVLKSFFTKNRILIEDKESRNYRMEYSNCNKIHKMHNTYDLNDINTSV